MSSLPSEAEARKILADKRSGQAVMDDYLKSQAEALGFIDTASEDDASRASSQNDAAPLVAAPTLVAEPAASAATVAEGPGDPAAPMEDVARQVTTHGEPVAVVVETRAPNAEDADAAAPSPLPATADSGSGDDETLCGGDDQEACVRLAAALDVDELLAVASEALALADEISYRMTCP